MAAEKTIANNTIAKNTICVWYDRGALEAARFYAKTFPDSTVGDVNYAPSDYPSDKDPGVAKIEEAVRG